MRACCRAVGRGCRCSVLGRCGAGGRGRIGRSLLLLKYEKGIF
ncbi:hypothetical protein [Moraxella lacunata]